MIYKNAKLYQMPHGHPAPTHAELERFAFTDCEPTQAESAGFVPPFPGSDQLIHQAEGTTLVCLQIQQRILPSSVINKALAEKVAAIEEAQQRKVYRKERLGMKDEITQDLLPRAFTRDKRILAHYDHYTNLLIVDSTSSQIAEQLMGLLRTATGSLPAIVLTCMRQPGIVLAHIARADMIHPGCIFRAGTRAKLRLPGTSATAAFKDEDLASEEVQAHLHAGMQPEELELLAEDIGRFTLTDTLILKGIKLSDALIDGENGDQEGNARHDADYCLNVRTLRQLYTEIAHLFVIESAAPAAQPAATAA